MVYLVFIEPKSTVISVDHSPSESRLKNIRNDPRDVEPGFNEVVHDSQVLEEPNKAILENSHNINKNQVLQPPKLKTNPLFTGMFNLIINK